MTIRLRRSISPPSMAPNKTNTRSAEAERVLVRRAYGAGVFSVITSAAPLTAPAIDVWSAMAATTMPPPMIARISAYSAAEAPDSSARNVFRKVFMLHIPQWVPHPPPGGHGNGIWAPASISGWPAARDDVFRKTGATRNDPALHWTPKSSPPCKPNHLFPNCNKGQSQMQPAMIAFRNGTL